MKKSSILLTTVAVVLILALSIGSALAYFTATDTTEASMKIAFGATTNITEEVEDGQKKIVIALEDGSVTPVFVRAKAYSAYAVSYSGSGWISGPNGYWYYDGVLDPEGTKQTTSLFAKISTPKTENSEEDDTFNVVVIYEAVPATYNTDGTPKSSTDADAWKQ